MVLAVTALLIKAVAEAAVSNAPGGNDGAGGTGGSGVVIIKELAGTYAPGIHSMNDVYEQRKDGNWGS